MPFFLSVLLVPMESHSAFVPFGTILKSICSSWKHWYVVPLTEFEDSDMAQETLGVYHIRDFLDDAKVI